MGLATAITGAVVTVAMVAAVAVLAWHGTINGQAAIAFFSAIAGGGIVGGAAVGAHTAGVRTGVAAARGTLAPASTRERGY